MKSTKWFEGAVTSGVMATGMMAAVWGSLPIDASSLREDGEGLANVTRDPEVSGLAAWGSGEEVASAQQGGAGLGSGAGGVGGPAGGGAGGVNAAGGGDAGGAGLPGGVVGILEGSSQTSGNRGSGVNPRVGGGRSDMAGGGKGGGGMGGGGPGGGGLGGGGMGEGGMGGGGPGGGGLGGGGLGGGGLGGGGLGGGGLGGGGMGGGGLGVGGMGGMGAGAGLGQELWAVPKGAAPEWLQLGKQANANVDGIRHRLEMSYELRFEGATLQQAIEALLRDADIAWDHPNHEEWELNDIMDKPITLSGEANGRELLRRLLQPRGLGYIVHESCIEILNDGDPALNTLCLYDISWCARSPQMGRQLMTSIQATLEPELWQDGGASMDLLDHFLIVQTNEFVHLKLERFLAQFADQMKVREMQKAQEGAVSGMMGEGAFKDSRVELGSGAGGAEGGAVLNLEADTERKEPSAKRGSQDPPRGK